MRSIRRRSTSILLLLIEAAAFTGAVRAAEMCVFVGNWEGRPAHGVPVSALDLTTNKRTEGKSDSQGNVCFSDIPEGPYAVEASGPNMNVRYFPVRLGTERTMQVTFHIPDPGDSSDGPMSVNEALLSGVLRADGKPIEWSEMCLTKRNSLGIPICVLTNDLGEYALDVAPGLYDIEVCTEKKFSYESVLDLPSAGFYRERIPLKPLGLGCRKK